MGLNGPPRRKCRPASAIGFAIASGPGTTLHGLRVSYAAWWRRNGATTREVADLIGDESEVMGAHYTRHVEAEANITNAFKRLKEGT